MRIIVAIIMFIAAVLLAAYLAGYVMLYGGIVSAIRHVTAGAILRALFWEAGLIPSYLIGFLAYLLLKKEI